MWWFSIFIIVFFKSRETNAYLYYYYNRPIQSYPGQGSSPQITININIPNAEEEDQDRNLNSIPNDLEACKRSGDYKISFEKIINATIDAGNVVEIQIDQTVGITEECLKQCLR